MMEREQFMAAYPISDKDEFGELTFHTRDRDVGFTFATKFFCMLSEWVQLKKKLQIVVTYEPEGQTKVKISRIMNDANAVDEEYMESKPSLETCPVSDKKLSEEFTCNTNRLDLGAAFATKFFCILYSWLQLNKKLRIVVEYNPEKQIKVRVSSIKNGPNEKYQ
ncbi:hypothetical protein [Pectinatus frisingensis]|uniref:hypothetical protein n=1 Tax=Pectinatus frisingensis TaxID=865 RepID=UPI0018C60C7D|nr:hypothetical protein [Pectinatus frisingensis]